MWFYFVLALAVCHVSVSGSYVGMPCTSSADCTVNHLMFHSVCGEGKCFCDVGYFGVENQTYCSAVEQGVPCSAFPSGDTFCRGGVTDSECNRQYHVCMCPNGRAEVFTGVPKPFCAVERSDSPQCDICIATKGVCYLHSNLDDTTTLTCGCPCQYTTSNPGSPLSVGCDLKYAFTGQACTLDGTVTCIDPNSECSHDGQLSIESSCSCKTGYIAVRNPQNPRYHVCARRITTDVDPDCSTCIQNQGYCYAIFGSESMSGCECPVGRSSPNLEPDQACSIEHFHVSCTSDNMTVCMYDQPKYDLYSRNFNYIFAEHKLELLDCHFKAVSEDTRCLTLLYSDENPCGLISTDSKFTRAYSVWISFLRDKHAQCPSDLCMFAYCTYHKIAKTHTGLVDVDTKKITTSVGYSLRPEIDMNIYNKFQENVELIGSRLGDLVKLTIEITDDRGVYVALRAEVCVVSNMLSLDHPHAQSAVFILNGCPHDNGLVKPMPVFSVDPSNAKRIITNLFPLPKFKSDVLFFHCCVRVCIEESNCEPTSCVKKRSITSVTKEGRLVKRSVADLLKEHSDSPDLTTKVVGIAVHKPENNGPQYLAPQPIVVQQSAESSTDEKIKQMEERLMNALKTVQTERIEPINPYPHYYAPAPVQPANIRYQPAESAEAETSSEALLIAGIVGSCVVTLCIGLIIFFVCFVLPSRHARKVKIQVDKSDPA